jgi:23S rRNA (adenine2503-C2)-methyltransferase
MGEPSLNPAVLEVLRELPARYDCPGLMPSVSSVAPSAATRFFDELLEIKRDLYAGGRFQLQFSLHTTDEGLRDRLIPFGKWDLEAIAGYGSVFCEPGDRKVTLNSALARGMPLDPDVLLRFFDPDKFLIKITPLNPTYRATEHELSSYVDPALKESEHEVIGELRRAGYEVLLSIGELEENLIGSNCGQYVIRHLEAGKPLEDAYTYELRRPA